MFVLFLSYIVSALANVPGLATIEGNQDFEQQDM